MEDLQRLATRLERAITPGETWVYLHGSAVLGGWVPGSSDVDVLVVSPVTEVDAARVRRACRGLEAPVELSVLTPQQAAEPASPWPFTLHLTTRPEKAVLDDGSGDPDLLMHIAVTREHGRALAGPPPREVFGPVSPQAITAYLADELTWGLEHAGRAYAVLNACRALCWSRTGRLVSKVDGGRWALRQLPEHAHLVETALADQRAGRRIDDPGAADLVDLVRVELGRS